MNRRDFIRNSGIAFAAVPFIAHSAQRVDVSSIPVSREQVTSDLLEEFRDLDDRICAILQNEASMQEAWEAMCRETKGGFYTIKLEGIE